MANNNKKGNNKKGKQPEKKKAYKNPTSTVWGKALICFLALAMLLSGLITLIVMLCLK